MIPTLFGPHAIYECVDCGVATRGVSAAVDGTLVAFQCPACGGGCRQTGLQPGDRLQLIRGQAKSQGLRRFDLVAFMLDGVPHVKRIWGLPGESLRISGGEFIVDGKPLQKKIDELLQVAVPVAAFTEGGPRWRVRDATSRDAAVVEYSHRIPIRRRKSDRDINDDQGTGQHAVARMRRSAIDDNYPWDLEASYPLRDVEDVGIHLRFHPTGTETAILQIRSASRVLTIILNRKAPDSLQRELRDTEGRYLLRVEVEAWIAVCDGRLLLHTDCESMTVDLAGLRSQAEQVDEPEGMEGQAQFRLELEDVQDLVEARVFRDLQVRTEVPRRSDSAIHNIQTWGLGPAEYFLLGDNLPSSLDSRDFGGISAHDILGRVHRVVEE